MDKQQLGRLQLSPTKVYSILTVCRQSQIHNTVKSILTELNKTVDSAETNTCARCNMVYNDIQLMCHRDALSLLAYLGSVSSSAQKANHISVLHDIRRI